MHEEEIIKFVLKEAFYVHSVLGPGMLESAYQKCLAYRLRLNGLFVEEEKPVPIVFEEVKLDCGYRADLLIERKVVVENKCMEAIAPIHIAQLLTHLRFLNLRFGLLLNFNTLHLKDGIKRVLNGYAQPNESYLPFVLPS